MAYQATVAASLSQFGITEIDFNLEDDAGVMPARRVSRNVLTELPTQEDLDAAAQSAIAYGLDRWAEEVAANAPKPDYYTMMKAALDGNIAPGTYEAVAESLSELGGQQVVLNDSITLDVTATPTAAPEDIEAALQARVDSKMFPGAYQAVKTVLKAAGFSDVKIQRQSNLNI